ncbi:glucosamine-6-phosphate deaminase [Synechococcus sp. A10-1-5-1]|uniref:glucosamine-6-phosphate deaminase n=1 Tax=Synechococcus sp. A10-1-5-1 TaxID=2936507 RepID=UPI0020009F79|nr:glucosamine-6-phosphate deaminase [Synechococcus sp. A10-1-5-1]UPM49863.1 glucosamine-6-phosphate deaminase [Synechococcus sp. A10-1-5-1]
MAGDGPPFVTSQLMTLTLVADAAAVAELVAGRLLEALRSRGNLGLATGRTMLPVYGALVRQLQQLPAQERQALLAGWSSFNLDEYVGLGAEDPRSFAAFMDAQLGVPLQLAPGALRIPDGRAPDPQLEALRYRQALQRAGGIGLQLLGLGGNGHVGFNEPPCGPEMPCRALALSPATREQNAGAFGGDPASVPDQAITLGTAEILGARSLLLVVTGGAKAEILRRTLQDPPCDQVPASWVQRHPQLEVVADPEAAAALS